MNHGSGDSKDDDEKCRDLEKYAAAASAIARDLKGEWYAPAPKRIGAKSSKLLDKDHALSEVFHSLNYGTILTKLMFDDGDTRVVNGSSFPVGHGRALGEALRGNTTVERLDLDLDRLLLAETEDSAKYEIKDLLEFLAKSKSLVHFGVEHCRSGRSNNQHRKISSLLLERISQCQQLQQLTWELHSAPPVFHRFMTTMPSLEELCIQFIFRYRGQDGETHYSANDRQQIASAFRLNKTLQKLTLSVENDLDTFKAILGSLHEHCTLRDFHCLAIETFGPDADVDVESISLYLGSTSTLERFKLTYFPLTGSDMSQLLLGLQHPRGTDGLPTTHLCSLHFDHCDFDEDSLEQLFNFLQTATSNSAGHKVYESCLTEFALEGNVLNENSSVGMAASLCMATATNSHGQNADPSLRPPNLTPTIGSQLHSLSLDRVHERFLYHLADNADRVRLQTLEMRRLDNGVGLAFYTSLPKLVSLRKLKVSSWQCSQRDLYWIVRGLKGNGSISEVVLDEDTRGFSAPQRRLIDAYCQRNQHWDALMTLSTTKTNDAALTATVAGATTAQTNLRLCSTLFGCVQQLEYAGSTMVMRGLSAIDDESTDVQVPAARGVKRYRHETVFPDVESTLRDSVTPERKF